MPDDNKANNQSTQTSGKLHYGDKISGDKIGGDKVGGDKLTVGSVSESVVAVGAGARAEINQYTEIIVKLDSIEDVAPAPGEPPYKGLAYFTEDDADIYYGRESLSHHITTRLNNLHFLALIGASGSGKSSLLRAGLIPRLRREKWLIHVITPGVHPLDSLANSFGRDVKSLGFASKMKQMMAKNAQTVALMGGKFASQARAPRLLIAVDQFEEVFTQCRDENERRAFVDNLLTAANQQGAVSVMIGLRADFYDRCAQFEGLRELVSQQQEFIGPMNQEELVRVIAEPAKRGNWQFVEGLVEQIIEDAGQEPGRLPLLSHALRETWERRRGTVMTLSGYRDAGGVEGAIAKTAEETLSRLDDEKTAVAQSVFLSLTELGEGAEDTRRIAPLQELEETNPEPILVDVLQTLVSARLITTSDGQVEVAHEALIRRWPRLREWLADNREHLRFERQLAQDAQEWQALEQDIGALYRGARLQQALEWSHKNEIQLTTLSSQFLEASRDESQREAREKEAQRQRELAQQRALANEQQTRAEEAEKATKKQKRLSRIAYSILALAVVAALVALFFGIASSRNAQQAEANEKVALSRQLASQAINTKDNDMGLALQLAVQADLITKTMESRMALYETLMNAPYRILGRGGNVTSYEPEQFDVQFSSDNRYLIVSCSVFPFNLSIEPYYGDCATGNAAIVSVWDVETGQRIHKNTFPYELHKDPETDLKRFGFLGGTLSSDGRYMAFKDQNDRLRLWDIENQQIAPWFDVPIDYGDRVAFSGDGKRLATLKEENNSSSTDIPDQTLQVWDVSTGVLIFSVVLEEPTIYYLALNYDGSRLAISSSLTNYDDAVQLWNVNEKTKITTISLTKFSGPFSKNYEDLLFSPEIGKTVLNYGSWLISDIDQNNLFEYENSPVSIIHGQTSSNITPYKIPINTVSFDASGTQFIVATADKKIHRSLIDQEPYPIWEEIISSLDQDVLQMVVSSDNQMLATIQADGTVYLWNIEDSTNSPLEVPHDSSELVTHLSPDGGKLLISTTPDNTVIQDMRTSTSSHLPIANYENPYDFNLNNKLSILTFIANEDQIYVWDTKRDKLITYLSSFDQSTEWENITLSANGEILAGINQDGEVDIWQRNDASEFEFYDHIALDTGNTISLAINATGQYLALAENTQSISIKIWDTISKNYLDRRLQYTNPESHLNKTFRPPELVFHPSDPNTLISATCYGGVVNYFTCKGLLWDINMTDPMLPPLFVENMTIREPIDGMVSFSNDGKQVWFKYHPLELFYGVTDNALPLKHSDTPVLQWNVDAESWGEIACDIMYDGQVVPESEWSQYIGDIEIEYETVCEQ